ncbi:iron ABC transporter permease [Xanthobacter sp. KR7-225]|uniref:ABC transporter permease n=1 Tax=Xanthobacter sp. KR7-225 TaxID=3156613 RepID=UPI0032B5091E
MTDRAPHWPQTVGSEQFSLGASLQIWTRRLLFALVGFLLLGPLIILLLTSVTPPGQLPLQASALTLENYLEIFTRRGTFTLLRNTVVYAGSSVILGMAVAIVIAWLTERTDLRGRVVVRILMFSWMAVPPLVFGYGWILLTNPGNGALNALARAVFGLSSAPFTPYSAVALIAISGLGLVPTCYVMISGLLRNMDPSLEDAGHVIGASRLTSMRKITIPLMRPGLLSASIYLVMGMVQTFDLPLILGTTAQYPVLSTRIFLLASPDGGLPNYGAASAFGVVLLVLALGLMWVYFRATAMAERFRIVSGKSFRPKRSKLGRLSFAAYAFVCIYFLIMLLPLLILLWTSLFPFYRVPALAELATANLSAYARVLYEPTVQRALVNTALLVGISSTSVMFLSCLISWFSVRTASASSKILDVMAFLPTAIPPIVMAIAMLLLFMRSPIYGTVWVLIIGHVTIFLPFGTRTMNGALLQIHKELEDAATICGAAWLVGLRRIILPLVWPHALNAWLWVFAHSARDLTFPLMLMTSNNVVLASTLYLTWDYPDQTGAAAIAVIMVGVLMLIVVPVQLYSARRAGET